MFTEFLHPQLVLFGQFSNNKVQCKHHYQLKDGEIIVHQVINRAALYSTSLINTFMQLFNQKKQQADQNEWDDQPNRAYSRPQRYHQQEYDEHENYDEEENEEMRGYEGYFDQDGNPYDEEVYGMNMDAQYLPEQFNGLYDSQKKKSPHSLAIPFQSVDPKKQNKEQQQDDQGWITQEQEEYYVNQQLEQAAANFATDFMPEALE